MNLKEYFEGTKGIGVLSTSDKAGNVNAAIYARPHLTDDGQVAFIMADRLSHSNLQKNPKACYLFREDRLGYKGKRLYLKKISETDDEEAILKFRRKCPPAYREEDNKNRYLVFFGIEKELPLIGTGDITQEVCKTCSHPMGEHGHLCTPVKKRDKHCDWCGSTILDPRHLCSDKVRELSYICNSCGRAAVKSEELCRPKKIKQAV